MRAQQRPAEIQDQPRLLFDLLARLPGFMALTRGPDHRFVIANAEFRRLSGRDPLGATVAEALPELQSQGIVAMLDRVFATGQPFRGRDMALKFKVEDQWEERVIDFTSQPVLRADGSFEDILCFGHDVSERVRAEREMARLQQELKTASQAAAMNTMASSLAHELNQPLAAAAAYLAAARRARSADRPDSGRDPWEILSQAEEQVHRAGEIIRRTRAALTQAVPRKAPTLVGDLLGDALAVLRASGVLEGIDLKVDPGPHGLTVAVDRIQIEQVLINAIRNACQAMAGLAEKTLVIRAWDEGAWVYLTVRDNGCGLASDATPFSPFQSSTGGMGIGLMISRTIVDAHGGRIEVDNNPERGATVTIHLPGSGSSPESAIV